MGVCLQQPKAPAPLRMRGLRHSTWRGGPPTTEGTGRDGRRGREVEPHAAGRGEVLNLLPAARGPDPPATAPGDIMGEQSPRAVAAAASQGCAPTRRRPRVHTHC